MTQNEAIELLLTAQLYCERESWIGRVQAKPERDDSCAEASNILWGLRKLLEKGEQKAGQ